MLGIHVQVQSVWVKRALSKSQGETRAPSKSQGETRNMPPTHINCAGLVHEIAYVGVVSVHHIIGIRCVTCCAKLLVKPIVIIDHIPVSTGTHTGMRVWEWTISTCVHTTWGRRWPSWLTPPSGRTPLDW